MDFEFLDGTLRFPRVESRSVDSFALIANFSSGVGKQVSIFELDRLQALYGGRLDIESIVEEPGELNLRVREHITACCSLSALRQARNLQDQLHFHLGLLVNLAESDSLKL